MHDICTVFQIYCCLPGRFIWWERAIAIARSTRFSCSPLHLLLGLESLLPETLDSSCQSVLTIHIVIELSLRLHVCFCSLSLFKSLVVLPSYLTDPCAWVWCSGAHFFFFPLCHPCCCSQLLMPALSFYIVHLSVQSNSCTLFPSNSLVGEHRITAVQVGGNGWKLGERQCFGLAKTIVRNYEK